LATIRKLASDTALYGLGSLVPRFLNFLLFPLQTSFFAPGEYGLLSYLYIYVAFLNVVYTFGMETAYFRFASKPGADEDRVFRTAQTFVVSVSLVFTILFIVFSSSIGRALHAEEKAYVIIWLAIILLIDNIVAVPFARLRFRKQPVRYAAARIINVLLLVGLNLLFLKVFLDPTDAGGRDRWMNVAPGLSAVSGIAWVFLANLIANLFYVFFFLRTLLTWRPKLDKALFGGMFHYAYPVMLMGISGMINEMFSRWALEWWWPEAESGRNWRYALGVLSAAFKYAIIMNLAIQAFRYAADPFFFSRAHDKNSPRLFALVNHFFVLVCGFILVAVAVNMDTLKYLMGQEAYYEGIEVVPLLLFSYLLLGIYFNLSVWFKLTDKTYYGTLFALLGTVVTVLANYWLVPRYGYLGAAWASVACYASMVVVCFIVGQRHYPVPYKVIRGVAYIVLAFACIAVEKQVFIDSNAGRTLFQLTLPAIYLLIVWIFERKNIRAAREF
jgi:O-antigen/teichoic acid export membrane protein